MKNNFISRKHVPGIAGWNGQVQWAGVLGEGGMGAWSLPNRSASTTGSSSCTSYLLQHPCPMVGSNCWAKPHAQPPPAFEVVPSLWAPHSCRVSTFHTSCQRQVASCSPGQALRSPPPPPPWYTQVVGKEAGNGFFLGPGPAPALAINSGSYKFR